MKIFAFIFARKGSKGIKNKNIIKVKNKPLIYYSIKVAKEVKKIKAIYVSSDSDKILKYAKSQGAYTIKRPKSLSLDHTAEVLAWKHAIKKLKDQKIKFDVFLSLPTTAPLRSAKDINKILNLIRKNKNVDFVMTAKKSHHNPWFNMVIKKKNGYFKKVINKKKIYKTRQELPVTFDITTVGYAARPEYILKKNNLMSGKVKIVEIPEERALDIDTKFDLKLAKLLIK